MFWTHKRKERPSSFDGSEIAIQLSSGGFYQTEQPIKSQNQMYCVYPYEEDNDTSFSAFTLDCIRLVLADFPFVLESAMGHDIYPIDCYPLIEAYRNAGGQFILAEKHRLLAKVSAPALVTLMPEFDRRFSNASFMRIVKYCRTHKCSLSQMIYGTAIFHSGYIITSAMTTS